MTHPWKGYISRKKIVGGVDLYETKRAAHYGALGGEKVSNEMKVLDLSFLKFCSVVC